MTFLTEPSRSSSRLARRYAALAMIACASGIPVHAQQAVPLDARPPAPLLVASNTPGLDLASSAGVNYSSSSASIDGVPPVAASGLNVASLSNGMQPPPRRRYGRPRYNDASHNPDGSNKYTFVGGVGFTAPVGNTYHYLNTGYAVQVGAGRNFNKNFSMLVQFDYDRFGFNGRTLFNEQAIYNYGLTPSSQYYLPSLDGSTHIWSFTLNPIFNVYQTESVGAYVVGGVGFYHKVANFTTPVTGTGYDPYFGYYQYNANQTIDHYTSNAPGFNGGVGLTFKPSRFASQKLFVEGRYVYIDNSQRYGYTVANVTTTTYNGFNAYPANSNRTSYTVYKAGVRF